MKKLLFLMALALLLAACAAGAGGNPDQKTGVLEGTVTVGPLSPVEHVPEEGATPEPVPPEVYTSRSINIYRSGSDKLVASVHFNPDGTYRELAPGDYRVDTPPGTIEHAAGLPAEITIRSGETTTLDLDIDTGIR